VFRLRALALQRRDLIAPLLLAVLCMKLLVPAGFMPMFADGGVSLVICPGMTPAPAMTMPHASDGMAMSHAAMPMQGEAEMPAHPAPSEGHGGKVEQPCAFAGLAMPTLTTADPWLLAIALAFILALGTRAAPRRALPRATRERPPLRGPPATA
jgi:hypothetical protein